MNFIEAKEKLKEIAAGRYHCINYSLTETREGVLIQDCKLYIEGGEYHAAPTWDLAFSKLVPPSVEVKDFEEIENPPQPFKSEED